MLDDLRDTFGKHHKCTADVDDHEDLAYERLAGDVAITHSGHGDQHVVEAVPECDGLGVAEVPERVASVLHLLAENKVL